ncbi:MAG: hypothetical protein ACRD8O_05260, partial [Bryobacteraceae bacterium]
LSDLEIRPRKTYDYSPVTSNDRLLTAPRLRMRRTLLASNERGQLSLLGSLDGLATGLLLYEAGRFDVLAATATPGFLPGSFISDFDAFSLNENGEVLTRVVALGGRPALLLASREGARFVANEGMFLGGGVEDLNAFLITRSSLTDSGEVLFRAAYRITNATLSNTGLFRIRAGGSIDLLASSRDGFTLEGDLGLTRDGVTFFRALDSRGRGVFRQQGFDAPARVIGAGDALANSTVRDLTNTTYPNFLVAPTGDLVFAATLQNNALTLVHYPGGDTSAAPRTLTLNSLQGVFAFKPGAGVLFYGNAGNRGTGLYLWKESGADPVLLHNQPAGNGENVFGFDGGAFTPAGEVVALVRTPAQPFAVIQINPERRVLFESGADIGTQAPANFLGFIGGGRTGPPLLLAGGNLANVAQFDDNQLRPLLVAGDKVAPGIEFFGASGAQLRRSPNGDLYVSVSSYGGSTSPFGLFRFSGGRLEQVLRYNARTEDGITLTLPTILSVIDGGTMVLNGGTDRNHSRLYRLRGTGEMTFLASNGANPDYVTNIEGFGDVVAWNDVALDASGRVMAALRFRSNPNVVAGLFLWDETKWLAVAAPGATTFGATAVGSISQVKAGADRFFALFQMAGGGSTLAEYRDGKWNPVFGRDDLLPTGQTANNIAAFEATSRGDVVFRCSSSGGQVLVRRTPTAMHLVHASFYLEGAEYPLNSYTDIDPRDDGTIYFLALDVNDRLVLLKADPTP